MSKRFLFRFLMFLGFLIAAVLWLLSNIMEEEFGFFNLSWAVMIVSVTFSFAFFLRGMFSKTDTVSKKFNIYVGAGFCIIALYALISAITVPKNLILPIIAIIITAALLLGVIATGGKKWDEGNNQKVGYKNYHQRKAEEEKQKEKNKS